MTRIKIVMTMMTGVKDFSTLEFIVWPPSSPWERESEWGDLIVPVSFGWTESCRFFTSTFFAIVITSLWNYSYSLFIHMQRFFNPLLPLWETICLSPLSTPSITITNTETNPQAANTNTESHNSYHFNVFLEKFSDLPSSVIVASYRQLPEVTLWNANHWINPEKKSRNFHCISKIVPGHS